MAANQNSKIWFMRMAETHSELLMKAAQHIKINPFVINNNLYVDHWPKKTEINKPLEKDNSIKK